MSIWFTIDFKILLLVYKGLISLYPTCLLDLLLVDAFNFTRAQNKNPQWGFFLLLGSLPWNLFPYDKFLLLFFFCILVCFPLSILTDLYVCKMLCSLLESTGTVGPWRRYELHWVTFYVIVCVSVSIFHYSWVHSTLWVRCPLLYQIKVIDQH